MTYNIIFVTKAKLELLESWEWYEDRQVGLGERFKEEVYKAIQQIERNPKRYPIRKKPYYEKLVDVFPYLVIYRIEKREKIIVIVSIFHAKRNPRRKYK
ncbi:MAG: type II toxin-antitoxin system RelE/ParE family toxin [Segetibacter sp.]